MKKQLNRFINAKDNESIYLTTGEKLEKIPINVIKRNFPVNEIDDRFWVLIAYEFLSVFAGKQIYDNRFDNIRSYLNWEVDALPIKLEKKQTGKYEAIHGIIVDPLEKEFKIHIRLFRWIAAIVTF